MILSWAIDVQLIFLYGHQKNVGSGLILAILQGEIVRNFLFEFSIIFVWMGTFLLRHILLAQAFGADLVGIGRLVDHLFGGVGGRLGGGGRRRRCGGGGLLLGLAAATRRSSEGDRREKENRSGLDHGVCALKIFKYDGDIKFPKYIEDAIAA